MPPTAAEGQNVSSPRRRRRVWAPRATPAGSTHLPHEAPRWPRQTAAPDDVEAVLAAAARAARLRSALECHRPQWPHQEHPRERFLALCSATPFPPEVNVRSRDARRCRVASSGCRRAEGSRARHATAWRRPREISGRARLHGAAYVEQSPTPELVAADFLRTSNAALQRTSHGRRASLKRDAPGERIEHASCCPWWIDRGACRSASSWRCSQWPARSSPTRPPRRPRRRRRPAGQPPPRQGGTVRRRRHLPARARRASCTSRPATDGGGDATGSGLRRRAPTARSSPTTTSSTARSSLRVRFGEDGDPVDARLVGSDPSDRPRAAEDRSRRRGPRAAARWPTRKDVQVGEPAVAIGSPFGLRGTVTTRHRVGASTATSRSPNGFDISGVIQTDAAINPGNSRRARCSTRAANVVGVNAADRDHDAGQQRRRLRDPDRHRKGRDPRHCAATARSSARTWECRAPRSIPTWRDG